MQSDATIPLPEGVTTATARQKSTGHNAVATRSATGLTSPALRRFAGCFVIFLLPFVLFVAVFVALDPFKNLRYHHDYSHSIVLFNRDFASTEKYLKQYPQYHYDSFIFGTSRAITGFRTADWKPFLEADASPFKFDAYHEGIFGIWKKVQFIDNRGGRIRNAVVLVCPDWLLMGTNNPPEIIYRKHPALLGGGWFNLYVSSLKAWLEDGFFVRYIDYSIFHKVRPYMRGSIKPPLMRVDPISNDFFPDGADDLLEKDEDAYYRDRKSVFYARPPSPGETPVQIGPVQRMMLEDMKRVFAKQKTNVRIVVSPVYSEVALDRQDLEELRRIFGNENVFDFSGVNEITANARHYYEQDHFRPEIGKQIFETVYAKPGGGRLAAGNSTANHNGGGQ